MHFKKILGNGLLLAIPLGVIIYVFIKITHLLILVISPVAVDLGIDKILGELTLTIIALMILFLLVCVLGLLMQIRTIEGFGRKLETIALKLFPPLNQLKSLAAENLAFTNQSATWKAVIVYYEEKYNPAYLVEENDTLATFFIMKGTAMQDGEILIVEKSLIKMFEISSMQLHQNCRQFGKGFLSLIPKDGLE
ncbi:hypothetical protein LX64_02632 [Chitinophaga skermanii]|uniref:Uncharacterized protein n=1 Tax=Chitinophaga skermanii TaxID=331697 RepID=A0A327QP46_9BACT|nr:hypothetical protein [Chitinophaga skermanii]RAJ05474.1 hypothetical protein LX64_02632 [Chitinophaga skermanii]